ncbi:19102_t:CDS:2, partial [Gigaspora rosea]
NFSEILDVIRNFVPNGYRMNDEDLLKNVAILLPLLTAEYIELTCKLSELVKKLESMDERHRKQSRALKIGNAIIKNYARNFIIQNSEIFRLKKYYNSLNATLKNLKELVKEKSYQVNYNQHMK